MTGAVVVAAIGVGAGGAVAPTGIGAADVLLRAVFGATIALAATRADGRTLLWFGGTAAVFAAGPGGAVSGGAAFVAGAMVAYAELGHDRRRRVWQAVASLGAGIGANGLTRWADAGPDRLSAALAAAAALPLLVSGYRRAFPSSRRIARIVATGVAAFAFLAAVGLASAAIDADRAGADARGLVDQALADARAGNSEAAVSELLKARDGFAEAAAAFERPTARLALLVPGLAQNGDAAHAVAVAGRDVAGAAADALARADYRNLRIQRGTVDLASLRAMVAPVDDANAALDRAADGLRGVDTMWLLPQVRDPFDSLVTKIADTRDEGALAAEALQVAPGLLGAGGERRYFVAFTTPAESRALGGFIGNYGILHTAEGKVSLERDGDIHELSDDPTPRAFSDPTLAEYAQAQARWSPTRYFENLTAGPDPVTDARAIADLYPQVAAGKRIDGVLFIDPYGLAALMELTGPITVPGLTEPLTKDNAADFLLTGQYALFEQRKDRDERKDLLQSVAHETFDALTNRKLPGPATIGRALGPAVRRGRIRFVPFGAPESAFVAKLGLNRPFGAQAGSDVLALRTANSAANKLDVYLRREVRYDATVDGAGNLDGTVTVVLTNTAPTGLPDYVQSGRFARAPDGTNTQYVTVYTGSDLKAARLDGSATEVEPGVELGLRSSTTRVDIPRGGARTIEYHLGGKVPAGPDGRWDGRYHVRIVPQPLVIDDEVQITIRDGTGAVRFQHTGPLTDELVVDAPVLAG